MTGTDQSLVALIAQPNDPALTGQRLNNVSTWIAPSKKITRKRSITGQFRLLAQTRTMSAHPMQAEIIADAKFRLASPNRHQGRCSWSAGR